MRERNDSKRIINALLQVMLVSGAGFSIVIAPNTAQILVPILMKFNSKQRAKHFHEVAYYMRRKELIRYSLLADGSYKLTLTKKGYDRAAQTGFDELAIAKPDKWDGNWHLVLFDIPEFQRTARNALTSKLKQLEFFQLQKSVWIHPYPCEPIVAQIREVFRIPAQSVVCSEVSNIDRQALLKRHFKLI